MKGKTKHLTLTVLLLGLVGLVACGSPARDVAAPSPSPTRSTFDETEWTIVTPVGWTREDATSGVDAKKAIRYRGSDGSYFIVAIDPLGSDFAYDALWRYEVKGSGFEVVEKYECKGKNDEFCRSDDARYDGYVLWKSNTDPQKVAGHTWYFIFGNSNTDTADVAVFEEILESVRAKG